MQTNTHLALKKETYVIEEVLEEIQNQYFGSGNFNGMPIYRLADNFDIESDGFRSAIRAGIENEIITATFHGNTHIRAFSGFKKEQLLEWFDSEKYPAHICLYPHQNVLKGSKLLDKYKDSPYELELAKGAGQLDYRTFDLSVLEYYRNDPRYSYETDFIHGSISIESEYFESELVPESDQILLKTFGFAYDKDFGRYVAVFIRYLSDLSPEHQKVWAAKEIKGDIKLHPDYYASSIQGSWGTKISIFQAFVEELELINKMSKLIGKPELFRNSYCAQRPVEFGFLLRPTVSEFNDFVLLIDKMMSDNINKKFFEDDVPTESDEERDDGKIIVRAKGTIQILESWVNKYFHPQDPEPIDQMMMTFKKVRRLRQQPAHKVNTNVFDQGIFKKQRELVIDAYDAVRTLRMILANHPNVKNNPPDINERLFKGEIWDI
ncbi:diverged AAA-family ATPase containing protein [Psychromonas ingrahamii 37]|uniref:Diverged AAA-family ATPase containing protein n=1 Tax=Psychromonas ingrahamii (strain DSM 17664 / CCUG 51855 / 37) TaxID=357804 RepID=A1SR79_PSYIN|nr:diverged AAA-family ATPase containing protein [Psychromonas ingrahamii 37]